MGPVLYPKEWSIMSHVYYIMRDNALIAFGDEHKVPIKYRDCFAASKYLFPYHPDLLPLDESQL